MNRQDDTAVIRRPRGEDMSMDEILASIRRIISDEESADAPYTEKPRLKQDSGATQTSDPSPSKLSASEQLRALSSALYVDNEEKYVRGENKARSQRSFSDMIPSSAREEKNVFSARSEERTASGYNDIEKPASRTPPLENESVKAAMARIRRALKEEDHTQSAGLTEKPPRISEQEPLHNVTEKKTSNDPEDHTKINFKAENISDIPGFLKKFRQDQQKEREDGGQAVKAEYHKSAYLRQDASKEIEEADITQKPKYDVKKASGFFEDDSVMHLTDPLSPEAEVEEDETYRQAENAYDADADQAPETDSFNLMRQMQLSGEKAEGGDALELLILRCLRPMLKEWMDQNLQAVVEKVIRAELYKRVIK